MEKIRVILISSVRPEPTSGGEIILHRHLVDQPNIDLEVYGTEPVGISFWTLVRRMIGRLGRTKLRRWSEDIWVLLQGRWMDGQLPLKIDPRQKTVVMTVAHGDGFMAARRFAKRHRLPLVSFFQDWWPDITEVHGFAKRRLEQEFRELADESAAAICVSEGMKRKLGSRSCAVLPPIPGQRKPQRESNNSLRSDEKFRVHYSGNLGDYGPMLGEALKALEGNEHVELVVRGARPKWSADFAAEMKRQGKWLEFAPREELEAWLDSADAFLVPMEFDPKMRRRMETSFPSKLIEFAQFGKPLVVWGPEYCSAIEWAKQGCSALCVTERAPEHLAEILLRLALSQENRTRLAVSSFAAAQQDFDHKMLQERFLSILRAVAEDRVDSAA
jgi:glycosyltransferase involved in cell wall biosynthesis